MRLLILVFVALSMIVSCGYRDSAQSKRVVEARMPAWLELEDFQWFSTNNLLVEGHQRRTKCTFAIAKVKVDYDRAEIEAKKTVGILKQWQDHVDAGGFVGKNQTYHNDWSEILPFFPNKFYVFKDASVNDARGFVRLLHSSYAHSFSMISKRSQYCSRPGVGPEADELTSIHGWDRKADYILMDISRMDFTLAAVHGDKYVYFMP